MTGKIIKFPIGQRRQLQQGRPGEVFCPPLDIRFPIVYRIVQSMSREDLDEFGLHGEEPFAGYHHYTLAAEEEKGETYPGTVERSVVRMLDPAVDRV
jgi:hypothetical protein